MKRAVLSIVAAVIVPVALAAQAAFPTKFSTALAERADVRAALAYVDQNFERQVEEWIRLTEIPAPSGQEAQRAADVRAEFEKLGLPTTVDGIGNVSARRAGTGGGPAIVLAAHLDTVFPLGTNIAVNRETRGVLRAPGVFDDTAAVANLLQAARALDAANVRTRGDLMFLMTTQEEVGLKWMAYWLERNRDDIDMLIAIDGELGPA
jgi:acetylornithine deacetylase/succinyl-diaminopimelate desuccinylase-like protein